MNVAEWNDPDFHEPGVAVARVSLTLHAGRLREGWTPAAIVSLHVALARRLERHHARSWEALVADLALLADAEGGDEVEAGDGRWIGSVIAMKGRDGPALVRAVRTFHT
jgi:hypothetical protein